MQFVATPTEFKQAVRDDVTDIEVGTLYFESPDDCIDLSALAPTKNGHFNLRGRGGSFAGGEIARCFDGEAPLIRCSRDRDWEMRLEGLCFNLYGKQGMAFDFEYTQQMLMDDVRVQESAGVPFHLSTCGSVIRFLQLCWNRENAVIDGCAVTEIDNLYTQTIWRTDKRGGLTIGGAAKQPCLWITNPHNEGCFLRVENFASGCYRGGYHLLGEIDFVGCDKSGFKIDPDGLSAIQSTVFRWDGKTIDPRTFSQPKRCWWPF